ncbi:Calreticulin family-domain-containing protein [Dichotomocladium elegans]|nr:Calreticulin family-domain-containing protein [Dichotomocladium elegans]
MKIHTIAAVLGLASLATAEIYLHETFSDGEGWKDRWTLSEHREDLGKLAVSPGEWFADEVKSSGLRTTEDYRFYAVSTPITPFNTKGKDLIIQFDVKNDQNIDCGGSYVKVFSDKFDPKNFNGDSEYNIMFGPDFCGSKAMVHAILNYKGTNYDLKKTVSAPKDLFTHTYTLVIKPDQTYQILVDGDEKAAGNLTEDWDFLPPKTIKDPEASKPEDWVDEAEIDDPEDKKPEDYDNTPEFIPDPEATKPEDWDDDMDGDWEAPSIPNPDFQGPWTPKRIPNPDYKGPWVHPEIPNPEYKVDNEIYIYDIANLGLDLWQVKSGTHFDNFLVTDDIATAEEIRNESLELAKSEKEAKEAFDKKAVPEPEEVAKEIVEEEKLDEEEINLDDESQIIIKDEEEHRVKDEL